jgi:hypothetical protein
MRNPVDWILVSALVLAFAGIVIGMLEDVDRVRAEADDT